MRPTYQLISVATLTLLAVVFTTRLFPPHPPPESILQWVEQVKRARTEPCRYDTFSQVELKERVQWLEKYLNHNNAPVVEGHSSQVEGQHSVYARLFGQCKVQSIAEIGFNAGHSTLVMLMANPKARVQSFDLGEHASSKAAYTTLKRQFPLRDFNVIWGDSRTTVPAFTATYTGAKFDVIIVDGGHTYDVARADVLNMRALSHAGTVLIVDDTICGEHFCVDKVLDDLALEGVLQVTERIPFSFHSRGMSLARYL